MTQFSAHFAVKQALLVSIRLSLRGRRPWQSVSPEFKKCHCPEKTAPPKGGAQDSGNVKFDGVILMILVLYGQRMDGLLVENIQHSDCDGIFTGRQCADAL